MSDMQAVKVRLSKVGTAHENIYLKALLEIIRKQDHEHELDEYCSKHGIKYVNGAVYSAKIEELDSCGFVSKVRNDYDNFIEVTALWYNGGANLDEILEAALRDKDSEFND